MTVDEAELEKFRKIWFEFDQEGSYFIRVSQMLQLIKRLIDEDSVLITKRDRDFLEGDDAEIQEFIGELQIPVYHVFRDFHYWDVLNALVRAMFRNNWGERKQEKFEQAFQEFDDLLEDMFTKAQDARISMCETMRKEMRKNYNKLRSKVDRNKDGDAYDSRFVILVPRLIPRIRRFLARARARRAAAQAEQQERLMIEKRSAEVDQLLDVVPLPQHDLMEPTLLAGALRTFSGST